MKAANWIFFKNVVMTYGENVKRYCMSHDMELVRRFNPDENLVITCKNGVFQEYCM